MMLRFDYLAELRPGQDLQSVSWSAFCVSRYINDQAIACATPMVAGRMLLVTMDGQIYGLSGDEALQFTSHMMTNMGVYVGVVGDDEQLDDDDDLDEPSDADLDALDDDDHDASWDDASYLFEDEPCFCEYCERSLYD